MFTGIIETVGHVKNVYVNGGNRTFWIESSLANELKPDQSVSHNGVCLTVEEIRHSTYKVTAIEETLKKTNLGSWADGSLVNIERCLPVSGRLDGHFVQGHVDAVGKCLSREEKDGSWEFVIQFPVEFAELVIEKGSISLDGISLTAFEVGKDVFRVAVIPFTYEHTNIGRLQPGDTVNLEFDLLGKYISRKNALAAL